MDGGVTGAKLGHRRMNRRKEEWETKMKMPEPMDTTPGGKKNEKDGKSNS